MTTRRSFLLRDTPAFALGSTAILAGQASTVAGRAEASPAPLFEFATLRLQMGGQVRRCLEWLEKHAMPLFQKHRFGPVGFFTVDVGPHIPSVLGIFTYPSFAAQEAAWASLHADTDWAASFAELEKDEPAFYRGDSILLGATPFSPPLKAAAPGDPTHKVFELRIYEAPTRRQLEYLHERFAGGEIDLFHKSGIHPLLYADTIIGPNKPNMAYLIPFESEAHREKAWSAFRENPDWQRLRDESIRRGGEIVRNITNMLLVPASFSMVR
jgi:hypothetical protein